MHWSISHLIEVNSPGFVLTALIVCAVMAMIVALILGQAEIGPNRAARMGILIAVAGIGVWTTHFVAMLGYRPDMVLGYDLGTTMVSALASIALVGGPLAATLCVQRLWKRVPLGAMAGAGVGVMHFIGMNALQGCEVIQSPVTAAIAVLLGMLGMGGAVAIARIPGVQVMVVALIVLSVCALHFFALTGVTLDHAPETGMWIVDPVMLSAFVAFASLILSTTAFVLARANKRLDALAVAARHEEEKHFRILSAALGNMSNGIVMFGPDACIVLYNDRARALLKLDQDELAIGMSMAIYVNNIGRRNQWDEATITDVLAKRMEVITNSGSSRIEQTYADGSILSIGCQPMSDGGAILTYDDVTAQRTAEADSARQYEFLSTALRNMSNGFMMVEPDGAIRLCNDRACDLLGLDRGGIAVGMSMATCVANTAARHGWDEATAAEVLAWRMHVVANRLTFRDEQVYPDGTILSIGCEPTSSGGAIMTFDDVTDGRTAQAELEHIAYHDALTGLPNRRAFEEHLENAFAEREIVPLLLLDLDRFKLVNDTLGHPVGDKLLVKVGARLRAKCRQDDLIYRLGGDEFAIVPRDLSADVIEELAKRVIADLGNTFLIDGNVVGIGCSVGFAISTAGDTHEQLVQHADLALYRAKDLGRNRVERYEEEMIEAVRAGRRLEDDIAQALSGREFELCYQPVRALPDGRLAGFKALIRWNHLTRGALCAAEFIPLAEKSGSIAEIGAWAFNEACRQAARWPAHLRLSMNVSPVQIRSGDMVAMVTETLERHGAAPQRLELELTETAMVRDGPRMAATLIELRKLGVRVTVNEFGTGYSSLPRLREFEVDCIKIDRSFINAPVADTGAWAVMRAVVGLARDLSIETVADGVETPEQLARLVEIGCSCAQGSVFAAPMDSRAAAALIETEAFADDAANEWAESRRACC